jgi:hypothetical protein
VFEVQYLRAVTGDLVLVVLLHFPFIFLHCCHFLTSSQWVVGIAGWQTCAYLCCNATVSPLQDDNNGYDEVFGGLGYTRSSTNTGREHCIHIDVPSTLILRGISFRHMWSSLSFSDRFRQHVICGPLIPV